VTARVNVYGAELGTAFARFLERYEAMTTEERGQLATLGKQQLDEALEDDSPSRSA
jgi:hypothetical protein